MYDQLVFLEVFPSHSHPVFGDLGIRFVIDLFGLALELP